MSGDCLFCKIVSEEVSSDKVYEDEKVVGFVDIYPQAKTHLLFIHKNHTSNIIDLMESDSLQLADLFVAVSKYTQENSLAEKGFRVVINTGAQAGQTVFHTHLHLLGGEPLGQFGS